MKSFAKRFICSCALLCAVVPAVSVSPAHADSALPVKIQINDEIVQFPEVQPFIDANGTLQVPLRTVSEKLGYKVDWSVQGDGVFVFLESKKKDVMLKTDDPMAFVDSKKVSLESKPTLYEGSTYAPLRFIAETFGSPIEWNEANQIAIVSTDGKQHQPAWVAPPAPLSQPAPVAAPEPSLTEQIAQLANAYIGVPYAWGGTTPQGFDCSGFVRYVFQEKGVELPRTSVQIYDQAGTSVPYPQVGDLVFFGSGIVNHVGIYLGDNQFISATSSSGVAIESLASTYWSARYVGAKRVL